MSVLTMTCQLFTVEGYYRDDKETFSGYSIGLLPEEFTGDTESIEFDDSIFYYVSSIEELEGLASCVNDSDFILTSIEKSEELEIYCND